MASSKTNKYITVSRVTKAISTLSKHILSARKKYFRESLFLIIISPINSEGCKIFIIESFSYVGSIKLSDSGSRCMPGNDVGIPIYYKVAQSKIKNCNKITISLSHFIRTFGQRYVSPYKSQFLYHGYYH